MELTITEALVKLKLQNKKIADATARLLIGYTSTNGSKSVPGGFKTSEEFKAEVKARVDSVTGLIAFRDSLKRAIITSNANTMVQIGNKRMSVAEAIEAKQGILLKKGLYDQIAGGLKTLNASVDKGNAGLDKAADAFVQQLGAITEEDRVKARQSFIENNKVFGITHDQLQKTADTLAAEIEEFTSLVDTMLSISNAKTTIIL